MVRNGAASLTERLYAWPTTPKWGGAAGVLICTTASDSEGTLGGLVALAEPSRFQALVASVLRRAESFYEPPSKTTFTIASWWGNPKPTRRMQRIAVPSDPK